MYHNRILSRGQQKLFGERRVGERVNKNIGHPVDEEEALWSPLYLVLFRMFGWLSSKWEINGLFGGFYSLPIPSVIISCGFSSTSTTLPPTPGTV